MALPAVLEISTPAASEAFLPLVFDSTAYRQKPPPELTGLRPIRVIYEHSFWRGEEKARIDLPDNRVRAAVRGPARENVLVCLDIERWDASADDPQAAETQISRYLRVAQVAHESQPGLRFGFYGLLPVRDYWAPQHGRDSWEYRTWQEKNRRLMPLAKEVDVVFPSLYTFYDDQEGWVRYAKANLEEARIYGRPVYAFLWPEFHGEDRRGEEIPGPFWRLQLETCAEFADGIVIWGGWDLKANKPRVLNEESPWWIETRAFLDRQFEETRGFPDEARDR